MLSLQYFFDDDNNSVLYECDFLAPQELNGESWRCKLEYVPLSLEELQKLDNFMKSLPLEKPQQQKTDPDIIILDETTKSFEVAYGSFKNKNRVVMTAKLDDRQEQQLQGILLELYKKAKDRPAVDY